MNASTSDNMVMEEISKSQNQLTKEIRSLYKKNEEIFSKIKSSDGLIKFHDFLEQASMQDLDSQQSESENEDFTKSEMSDENSNELNEISSEEAQLQTFLKLKEHGQSSRTKALRLKENDVIVAIDGSSYHESIDKLVDLLSSGEEDDMWLLTVWRNGKFFEIFTRGPLGGIFEFTRPEESQMIMELFQKREMGRKR